MRSVSGIVTVVQESRFRLLGDDQVERQFVLAHDAAAEPEDLGPLQRSQAHVTVRYEGSRDLIAGIARAIEVGDPSAARERGSAHRGGER
jgi:hypothetical protein